MEVKMVKAKRVSIAILAVALTALLLFTACAPAAQPAAGKKVVRIGMIAPFTGAPATGIQRCWRYLNGYLSYFEEVGVPGITFPPDVSLEVEWGDTQYQAPNAISVYERMMQRGDVVLFFTPSPLEAGALKSRFERDEMPTIVMALDETMVYPPGWIFAIYPTESERFSVVCDWIKGSWEEERPPRVAIMGTDSPSGRAPEVMGTKYAQSIGIEMLPFEAVPYLPLDASPQLLRLRDRGADFVYLQCIAATTRPIMQDVERLGLTGKMRFGGMENGQSIELLGLGGPVVEGFFATRRNPWYEEVPELFDIYGEKIDQGEAAANLVLYPVMIEAIGRAIEEVGYENLDGRAVKEGFYAIKDFDPHGLGTPVTYTPQDHRGDPQLRIYEIRGGKVVPVTDWRKPLMLVP